MKGYTNKTKVLHVISVSFSINYFFGKQFTYLKEKTGNEYHLACSPSEEFFELSKELDYIPFSLPITRKINPLSDLKAIWKLYKYIKGNKITKVIGHTPKGGMIAMIASTLAGISEKVYFRHGLIYETSSGVKRFVLKNIERLSGTLATKVVCVSYSIKEVSEKDKLNKPSKNIVLGKGTCNGIDTEIKYNPDSYELSTIQNLKRNLDIAEEDFVVGFVGRLVKDKGIDELILAWDFLKQKYSNVKLLLVGPIEDRDPISEFSKNRIKNDETILFTDFILDASVYYSLMNVFILPSYREGFPTVALEASSMGLPVLITNATGCREAVIESETGIFISHEPSDIACKIAYYIENAAVVIRHGSKGRKFVSENFEQTKIWNLISKALEI